MAVAGVVVAAHEEADGGDGEPFGGGELVETAEEAQDVVASELTVAGGAVGKLAPGFGDAAPEEVARAFGGAEVRGGDEAGQQVGMRDAAVGAEDARREANCSRGVVREGDEFPRQRPLGVVRGEAGEALAPLARNDIGTERIGSGVMRQGVLVVPAHQMDAHVRPRRVESARQTHGEGGATGGVGPPVDEVAEEDDRRHAALRGGAVADDVHGLRQRAEVPVYVADGGVQESRITGMLYRKTIKRRHRICVSAKFFLGAPPRTPQNSRFARDRGGGCP